MGTWNSNERRAVYNVTSFLQPSIKNEYHKNFTTDHFKSEIISHQIRLFISGKDLFPKTCSLYSWISATVKCKNIEGVWQNVGSTETLPASSNPVFCKSISLDSIKEIDQEICIEFLDPTLSDVGGELGKLYSSIHTLTQQPRTTFILSSKFGGSASLCWEPEVSNPTDSVLTFQAQIFPCLEISSKFFYELCRPLVPPDKYQEEIFVPIYRSAPGKLLEELNGTRLKWEKATLEADLINLKRHQITFILYEIKAGKFQKIYSKLIDFSITCSGAEIPFDIQYDKTDYGTLFIENTWEKRIKTPPSIPKSIITSSPDTRREKYHITFGIDFSLTNGLLGNPESLHTKHLLKNPYAWIMKEMGQRILPMDENNRPAVLGLGGNIPELGRSSCFSLNGNILRPEVQGLEAAIRTYLRALDIIKLSGPSKAHLVLEYFCDMIEQYNRWNFGKSQTYFILVMMLDCTPVNFDLVQNEILRLSSLPGSVVFFGMDNTLCRELTQKFDSKKTFSSSLQKEETVREVCQYIPFGLSERQLCETGESEKIFGKIMTEIHVQYSKYKERFWKTIKSYEVIGKKHNEKFTAYPELINKLKSSSCIIKHRIESTNVPDKSIYSSCDSQCFDIKIHNTSLCDETTINNFNPKSKEKPKEEEFSYIDNILKEGFPTYSNKQLLWATNNQFFANKLLYLI